MDKIKEVSLSEIPIPCIAQNKWDGELCFLFFDSLLGKWVTVNNWGHYRTDYPITEEAEKLYKGLLKKDIVYVGELCSGDNLYDFLNSKKFPHKLFLVIFDVLPNSSTRNNFRDYINDKLGYMAFLPTNSGKIRFVKGQGIPSKKELEIFFLEAIERNGFEGIVCRDRFSSWIYKVKAQRTVDVVIVGISKEGKEYPRKMIGCLLVGLYYKGEILKVGRCGIGFTKKMKEDLYKALMLGKIREDKKYVYVKPKVVMEIIYNQLVKTDAKKKLYDTPYTFRLPRLKRLRPDKPAIDCELSHQLPEIFRMIEKKKVV